MKTPTLPFISTMLVLSVFSQAWGADRPKITGIDHVSFYTTIRRWSEKALRRYPRTWLGRRRSSQATPIRYMSGKQWVGYRPAPDPKATDRMDHVAFTTDNIVGLRRISSRRESKPGQKLKAGPDHSLSFMTTDPEGHRVEFVERGKDESAAACTERRLAPHDPRRLSGLQPGRPKTISTARYWASVRTGMAA